MSESPPEQWSKIQKIQFLLDQWNVIFDPDATAPFGTPGDGSGVPLMPLMSRHPSVLELTRTLQLLFRAAPGDYRHLKAFRCGVEWRVVWRTHKIRGPHGKLVDSDPKPERVKILPAWISQTRVRRGEAFLEQQFRGDVNIPDELYHALTCSNPDCRKCWPVFAAA